MSREVGAKALLWVLFDKHNGSSLRNPLVKVSIKGKRLVCDMEVLSPFVVVYLLTLWCFLI